MQVVVGETVPLIQRSSPHRGGNFAFRRLLAGDLVAQIIKTDSDFTSPRHRHRFDQIRLQIEGVYDYGRSGKMKPGVIGYFPEGTHYGPSASSDNSVVLVIQFAGASGGSFADEHLTEQQLQSAIKELGSKGEFSGGIYRRFEEGPRRNLDAFQALWEQVNGKPMVYPQQRYQDPIFIKPENFNFRATAETGVQKKSLGAFTEAGTQISVVKLGPGSTHHAESQRLYFVMKGAGKIGADRWSPHTAVYLKADERGIFEAETETEFLVVDLPRAAADAV